MILQRSTLQYLRRTTGGTMLVILYQLHFRWMREPLPQASSALLSLRDSVSVDTGCTLHLSSTCELMRGRPSKGFCARPQMRAFRIEFCVGWVNVSGSRNKKMHKLGSDNSWHPTIPCTLWPVISEQYYAYSKGLNEKDSFKHYLILEFKAHVNYCTTSPSFFPPICKRNLPRNTFKVWKVYVKLSIT